MDEGRWQRLVEVMADLSTGDPAALAALYLEYGPDIARIVRGELRRQGAPCHGDDVEGVVVDVCCEIARYAPTWDPSRRVTPWAWMRLRVRAFVGRAVGIHADEFVAGHHDRARPAPDAAPDDGRDDIDVLRDLGRCGHRLAGLLVDALHEAGVDDRNQAIVVSYQMQAAGDDPSPANTVGARHALGPEAVRQVVCRTRRKLRDLAGRDPRFAALAETPLVA